MTRDPDRRHVALLRNVFLHYSEAFIYEEINHHVRYDVTVLTRQRTNADLFPVPRVVAIEQVPERRRHLASLWYALTARSARFDQVLGRGDVDLLHAHFGHNGVYATGYAARHRLPLVVSLHGRDVTVLLGNDKYSPAWWQYFLRFRRMFDQASAFLAASTELKDLIVELGCPSSKVLVQRLGVDIESFAPPDPTTPPEPGLVVMVGRFVEKKGHQDGIRAVAMARDAGLPLRLVIVGDGPLEPSYRRLIDSLGLAASTELTGPLPHAEVRSLLRRASVMLAPSVVARNLDRESGLIVAKEACACGVPVIGTRHGGIPDIIDDGATGYLVDERDHQSLGERLVALLGDEALRRRLGAAARAKMEREYDIRERVEALEEIYDAVVDGSL
jgi:glycosyltransferase involved in cell wall biosynthesis